VITEAVDGSVQYEASLAVVVTGVVAVLDAAILGGFDCGAPATFGHVC